MASRELGAALHVPWLVTLGRGEAWLALAAWAVVTLAMTRHLVHLSRVTIFGTRGMVGDVKRYKFQALVTVNGKKEPELDARLCPGPHRMIVRGQNEETHRSRIFAALVSCDDGGPFRPGSRQRLVTMRLTGDDVCSYFGVGEHFDLWLGDDVGQGVVTRRLFV